MKQKIIISFIRMFLLFKYKLLNSQTVDSNISQMIDTGNNKPLHFGLQLIRYFYIENAS
jgi:hypothetical protein